MNLSQLRIIHLNWTSANQNYSQIINQSDNKCANVLCQTSRQWMIWKEPIRSTAVPWPSTTAQQTLEEKTLNFLLSRPSLVRCDIYRLTHNHTDLYRTMLTISKEKEDHFPMIFVDEMLYAIFTNYNNISVTYVRWTCLKTCLHWQAMNDLTDWGSLFFSI